MFNVQVKVFFAQQKSVKEDRDKQLSATEKLS